MSSIQSFQAAARIRRYEFHRGNALRELATQEGPGAAVFRSNSWSTPLVNCVEDIGLLRRGSMTLDIYVRISCKNTLPTGKARRVAQWSAVTSYTASDCSKFQHDIPYPPNFKCHQCSNFADYLHSLCIVASLVGSSEMQLVCETCVTNSTSGTKSLSHKV